MIQRFRRLRQSLPADPPLQGRFLNILMDTTSACNLTCRMCPQSIPLAPGLSRRPDVMDDATMERLVREVLPHTAAINLSCIAEPTVNPRFPRLLDMLQGAAPPYASIVTNGMILPDDLLERIARAGLTQISVSLDAPTPENFNWIRRGGDFHRIVANIRRIKEFKDARGLTRPELQINCVLMRRNIGELTALVELAHELGAAELHMRHLLPMEGLEVNDQSLWDDQARADGCVRQAARRAAELGLRIPALPLFDAEANGAGEAAPWGAGLRRAAKRAVRNRFALPRCSQPWSNLVIHPNGEVFPCTQWFYDSSTKSAQPLFPPRRPVPQTAADYCVGNLREQTFAEIWNGAPYRRLREELMGRAPLRDLCRHCPLRIADGKEQYRPRAEGVDIIRKLIRLPAP